MKDEGDPISLTEEQRQRISENKKIALEKLELKRKQQFLLQSESFLSPITSQTYSDKVNSLNNLNNSSNCQLIQGTRKCCELWNDTPCESTNLDEIVLKQFNEAVCSRCKANSTDYYLIPKKVVQSEYLLTDDSLSLMTFVIRDNPINPHWTGMKMYLRKHARIKALKRFGSEEALNEEIGKRKSQKTQKENEKVEEDLLGFNLSMFEFLNSIF